MKKINSLFYFVNIALIVFSTIVTIKYVQLKKSVAAVSKLRQAMALPRPLPVLDLAGQERKIELRDKNIVFVASPIDCQSCLREASRMSARLESLPGLKIRWVFIHTSVDEMKSFFTDQNFKNITDAYIDQNFLEQIVRKTPSIYVCQNNQVQIQRPVSQYREENDRLLQQL